jgi:hypothetical protein
MMNYREYFRIEIKHQYFATAGSADLTIVPDVRTLRLLQGQHIIFKSSGNELKILIPVDENGVAKSTLDEALVLEIFPESSTFGSITDTSDLAEGEIYLFTNAGLPETASQLAVSPSPELGSRHGFPMIGRVEIEPTNALLTRTKSVAYQAIFKAKSAKWKYYFVSDHETTDLSIVDADGNLVFGEVDLGIVPLDQIGASIQENFPDTNLFLFESATPISDSDQALRNLQLFRDGNLIIKHLPNPEAGDSAIKIIKIHKLISKQ